MSHTSLHTQRGNMFDIKICTQNKSTFSFPPNVAHRFCFMWIGKRKIEYEERKKQTRKKINKQANNQTISSLESRTSKQRPTPPQFSRSRQTMELKLNWGQSIFFCEGNKMCSKSKLVFFLTSYSFNSATWNGERIGSENENIDKGRHQRSKFPNLRPKTPLRLYRTLLFNIAI